MVNRTLENLMDQVFNTRDDIDNAIDENTLYDYLIEYEDIEFIFDGARAFLGAIVTVSSGGPNIYLDTRNGRIEGFWSSDSFYLPLDRDVKNELNNILEEFYGI